VLTGASGATDRLGRGTRGGADPVEREPAAVASGPPGAGGFEHVGSRAHGQVSRLGLK